MPGVPSMQIRSDSFPDGGYIPPHYALGRHHPHSHVELSDNVNPHLAWSGVPATARSLVLLCVDRDAPSRRDDANQPDRLIAFELPRADFYHWVLVDLPAAAEPIREGEFSRGVTARGKPGPAAPRGTRAGLNDYTSWFGGDADMEGQYFGYDGPCPPWNDSRVHHYQFRLLALDLPRCPVDGVFTAPQVLAASAGHVVGEATMSGAYAINPRAQEASASAAFSPSTAASPTR